MKFFPTDNVTKLYDDRLICLAPPDFVPKNGQTATYEDLKSNTIIGQHVRPGKFVFTYQGDGDAAAIGLSETMYAAKRNEPITTFFVNNGVFGMTGGQMAPTSLLGQKTTTSPFGCDYSKAGEPIKLAELLATFNVGYIARGSIANYSELMKTKKYISKAIDCQIQNRGYSFVEILSP